MPSALAFWSPCRSPVRSLRAVWAVWLGLSLVACGGAAASRQLIVEGPRDSYASTIEAIDRAAAGRGYRPRTSPGQAVSFHVDREAGSQLSYRVKRNGLVMVVGVRAAEGTPPDVQQAELDRVEAIGRELMAEATLVAAEIEEQRAAEAAARDEAARQARQARAERRAERRARLAEGGAELDEMMASHEARRAGRLHASEPAQTAPGGGDGGGSSARCCLNGAYYDCPDAAAVDRCAGAFMRCMMSCGFSCGDDCQRSDPPDPSSCTRAPARDSEC